MSFLFAEGKAKCLKFFGEIQVNFSAESAFGFPFLMMQSKG